MAYGFNAVILLLALDHRLTPGMADPKVTQANIQQTICKPGWASKARRVSTATKKRVFKLYGVPWYQRNGYEVDHLIPLELGGSNSTLNLWPQLHSESTRKDWLEGELHRRVCDGRMTLTDAQFGISIDWQRLYRKLHDK